MTEPNNVPNQATAVSPDFYLQSNYFTNDSVSPGDPDDYFRFYNLYGPSTLYAVLNGLSADADLYVYDQSGNEIASSVNASNLSETINVSLPNGNEYYYVRVKSYQSANTTNYGLLLYNDYSGSQLYQARDLGFSWGQSTNKYWPYRQTQWQDYLDYRDNVDVVRFIMEAPGTISLKVAGVVGPGGGLQGRMELVDIEGQVLRSVSGSFAYSPTIDRVSLPADTYFVRYVQSSGSDTYDLRIVSDYAGDTTATARNVGNLTNNDRQFYDMVGNLPTPTYEDTNDLYKFNLTQAALVTLTLDLDTDNFPVPSYDANLRLARDNNNDGFISTNEVLLSSSQLGDDQIATNLSAGTYYAQVLPNGIAATNYQLNIRSRVSVIISEDPDDTIGEVVNRAGNTKTLGQFADFTLDVSTDVDLIKFTVVAGQKVGFDVDSRNASNLNTYLRIFKPDGTQLAVNDNGIAPGETNSQFSYLAYTFPQAGTYYVGTSLSPNSNYNPINGNGDVSGSGATGTYRLYLNDLGRVITGDANNNSLTGGNGPDSISGLGGNDNLNGGGGNDTLVGGTGNDLLTGGIGGDAFTLANIGDRLDTISDFNGSGGDILQISATGFGSGLTRGVLGATRFRSGAGITTANTNSQRFIYNTSTGALFFDANGSATGSNPMQLATLSGHPSLIPSQIVVM